MPHNGYVLNGDALSDREIEVLRYVANGYTEQQIAKRLQLSAHTIKTHKERLFVKLGVHTGAHAVAVAFRTGLIT